LARRIPPKRQTKTAIKSNELVSGISGTVELTAKSVSVVFEDMEERSYPIPPSVRLLVSNGAGVKAGDALTSGPLNPHDILRIRGKEGLIRYLIDEVQKVYRSQGVSINHKHIEVILRQMLKRVTVDTVGDSEFIPGEYVDRLHFQEKNDAILAEGGEPAVAKPTLLGVTRASLLTDSFLAAASFQETTRVLTDAVVRGARDRLVGLKENVIIGRLIPARKENFMEQKPALVVGLEKDDDQVVLPSWLKGDQASSAGGDGTAVVR
jgi:DNA-directed RNA polymerase subunit beta'